jgi:putative NADH-flavin reductase
VTEIPPRDWRDWVVEAQRIVEDWETATSQRMLVTGSAAALIVRIAQSLQDAYDRGQQHQDAPRPE